MNSMPKTKNTKPKVAKSSDAATATHDNEAVNHDLSFADLGLADNLVSTITDLGYQSPSPIQARAIPELLKGRDILGMAQTGTGKTAAFALPVLANLAKQATPSVLVLAPTRELAQQVAKAFESYSAKHRCKVVSIYGGAPYGNQMRALKSGVDVVVGTPGRVMDHMRRGSLDVSNLQTLVLDEADEMLRMGFIDDVEWVLDQTPDQRQIALFSATMPPEIARIANRYLNNPAEVKIEVKSTTATTITQKMILVQSKQKTELLTRVLEVEDYDAVMVFVRTKIATTELADALRAKGLSAESLSGDLSQEQREKTVARLKAGKVDIVIATDVAARGLDVSRISHVVNYDIPFDAEAYVHRIGRTGRAGRSGTAILFVQPREQRMLKTIERTTRSPIEKMEMPTVAQINQARQDRLTQRLKKRLERMSDKVLAGYNDIVDQIAAETEADTATIAGLLISELNGKQPFLLESRDELKAVSSEARRTRDQRETGRRGRNERPDRSERGSRTKHDGKGRSSSHKVEPNMERYRIEVGHEHGVKPGNIVGAIANEAGVDSAHIGRIELHDAHSFVDLPEGMPKDVFNHLKGVYVCQQRLSIAKAGANTTNTDKPYAGKKPKRDGSSKPKPKRQKSRD